MLRKTVIALFCLLLLGSAPALAEGPALLPAPAPEGLWGYVDAKSGEAVVAPRYASAGMFHNGAAVVHMSFPQAAYSTWAENGEMKLIVPRGDGLIDAQGKDILPPVDAQFITPASPYQELEVSGPPVLPGLYLVQNFSGRGVFDLDAGWLLEAGPHEDIRFMPDGSFIFNGGSYISAAPERNIYFAPGGQVIAGVNLATRTFVLESASQTGSMGVSSWSGAMLSKTSYRSVMPYAECSRWAGMTLGGRLDVFDASGEILQSHTPDFRPQMFDDGKITIERGGASFALDICGLALVPLVEYPQSDKETRPEPEFQAVLRDGRARLLDSQGNERIAPLYEMLLPAGYGYWWGRRAVASGEGRWVLIDSRGGKEIRMPE